MNEIIIIAGGQGTRSINPEIPKSLQEVGGKKIIEWQLENISNWISANVRVIGGYKGEEIQEYLERINVNYPNLNIDYYHDSKQNGTLPALLSVLEKIKTEKFIVLLGDLVININWSKLIQSLNQTETDGVVVTHPNSHPEDSDLIIENSSDQKIRFMSKNRTGGMNAGNLAVAGIFGFRTSILRNNQFFGPDIPGNLLSEMLEKYKIQNYLTVDYIKDAGTAHRINSINQDLSSGYFSKRDPKNRSVIFLDLDDTLHTNLEYKNLNSILEVHPRILEIIKNINKTGFPIVIITNQPGIAKGFFDLNDIDDFFRKFLAYMNEKGCSIDAWYFCPHHPETGWKNEIKEFKIKCSCRKPEIGMLNLFEIFNDFSPSRSWMLGNSISDRQFAKNAKLNFQLCTVDCDEINNKLPSTSEALKNVLELMEAEC